MTFSFDPYDPSLFDDPYETFARLRDEHPAYRDERHDAWALSRHADVKAALGDHETFCSSQGLLVLEPTDEYEAPTYPPGNLLLMDPPEHTAFRRIVSRAFTPKRVAEQEVEIRALANRLIDDFIADGEADLVPGFAVALPAIVFGRILGIPDDDWGTFQRWSATLVAPAPDAEAMQAHEEAKHGVSAYFLELLRDRRDHPRDDLMTALVQAEVDGRSLTETELVGFAIAMLIAGNDTTSNLTASGLALLAQQPDQRRLLVEDPSRIPVAIEELLRYESPVQGLARTLTRDVEIHGQQMRAGQKVLLLFGAANRDERAFPDADRLDVQRNADGHLSFGFGIHYCIGFHLGRLEARIAFETLLDRIPDYELAIDQVHYRQLVPTRPMEALPITFEAAA